MFVCPKCGKILVSKQAFTYHMNRKRPCIERFSCECKSQFKTKFDLYIHKINCQHCKDRGVQLQHDIAEEVPPKIANMTECTASGECIIIYDGTIIKEIQVMDQTFTNFQVKNLSV